MDGDSFKFALHERVVIEVSGEQGAVRGRAEYVASERSYLVLWTSPAMAGPSRRGGPKARWSRRSVSAAPAAGPAPYPAGLLPAWPGAQGSQLPVLAVLEALGVETSGVTEFMLLCDGGGPPSQVAVDRLAWRESPMRRQREWYRIVPSADADPFPEGDAAKIVGGALCALAQVLSKGMREGVLGFRYSSVAGEGGAGARLTVELLPYGDLRSAIHGALRPVWATLVKTEDLAVPEELTLLSGQTLRLPRSVQGWGAPC